MTVKNIEKSILQLKPVKRIQIVEYILASLNEPDPAIKRAWAVESEKRLRAYKNGSIKGLDWEIVKKRFVK